MNIVNISGKLCNVKSVGTKTGTSFATASIMLSRLDKKTQTWINGFVPVKAFNEIASQMLNLPAKSKVLLSGKLGVDSYKDKKTGEDKNSIYIMAFGIEVDKSTFGADPKAVEDLKPYELEKQIEDPNDIIPF